MQNTILDCYNAARGYLNDNNAEIFTNTFLSSFFNEPLRRMYRCLSQEDSKRVQKTAYLNLPAYTTVLIPENYGIADMAEPSKVEERPAAGTTTITSTSNTTPIVVTAPGHGIAAGANVEGTIGGVSGTEAPLGKWYCLGIDSSTFSLNGSMTDGSAGTGGVFTLWSQQIFYELQGLDLDLQGLDSQPTQYLGVYIWRDEQFNFPGATQEQQLRITYWQSATASSNVNTTIPVDDCIDFLSVATAANAARSLGWIQLADQLQVKAYGANPGELGGLLYDFVALQIRALQRDPQRRMLSFRAKRSRFGNWVVG